MKVIKRLCVLGAVVASFAPRAEVDIKFDSDITPLLVGGEQVGFSFFAKSAYTVEDGTNQVVLRVSKLVARQGEKEKFNSKAFVMTFNEKDQQIFIEPDAKIMRVEQAEAFDNEPSFLVTNKQGKGIKYTLDELPNLGGITRDFEKELAKYNKKHYPELAVATAATSVATQTAKAETTVSKQSTDKTEPNMFDYWLAEANPAEIEQFTDIALEGRKQPSLTAPSEASQPVQMLCYWFNKASVDEKKQILVNLISL